MLLASVADPECARGGGVSHVLAEKKGVGFSLLKNMHENAIFSQRRGGVRRVRPMLDPPLSLSIFILRSSSILSSLPSTLFSLS